MKLIILPGLGADCRMYMDPAYGNLQNAVFPDWPSYRGEQSITDLAKRIVAAHDIKEQDIIGGSSLGGIVAAEISRLVKIQKLILIGTTLVPGTINPLLKHLSIFAEFAPIGLMQKLTSTLPIVREITVIRMFCGVESSFIRAMSKAIFKWQGVPEPGCEVYHLHGARDRIIFPPQRGAEIIPDGGHLIAMTHGSRVSTFIATALHGE